MSDLGLHCTFPSPKRLARSVPSQLNDTRLVTPKRNRPPNHLPCIKFAAASSSSFLPLTHFPTSVTPSPLMMAVGTYDLLCIEERPIGVCASRKLYVTWIYELPCLFSVSLPLAPNFSCHTRVLLTTWSVEYLMHCQLCSRAALQAHQTSSIGMHAAFASVAKNMRTVVAYFRLCRPPTLLPRVE